jgi:hypothetical protein
VAELPLRLSLDPILPSRAPANGESALGYGYQLRIPDGPALEDDDPLLSAFGARIEYVAVDDQEALQLDVFEPGRPLTLLGEMRVSSLEADVGV